MIATALTALSIALSGTASAAAWTTQTPAASFTYAGRPIDPRCAVFDPSQDEQFKAFDLRRCAQQMRAGPPPERRDGTVSAQFPPTADGSAPGYATYSVIASNGRQFLLNAAINTGGTGIFTAVLLARKEGQALIVRRLIQGGDRCDGAIADPALAGHVLRYSLMLTPYDVIALAGPLRPDVEKGLEASAESCVATKGMEYDLTTGTQHFVALTLTGDPTGNAVVPRLADKEGWTGQFAYQHCFNAVYNSFVDADRTGFAAGEAKQFAQRFTARCVSPKARS